MNKQFFYINLLSFYMELQSFFLKTSKKTITFNKKEASKGLVYFHNFFGKKEKNYIKSIFFFNLGAFFCSHASWKQ